MIDLYYAEDDPNIANTVKEYLEQKDFKVTIYDTLASIKQALEIHVPAMVLLDWNMPDGRGDYLCKWIRGTWKELPIIFLTVRGDSCDIVSGFQNGADDYVVKPFELEVLYSRILALLRRTRNAAGQYLSCDGIIIDQNRRTVTFRLEEINLSVAEYQLLLYLMQNKGRVMTRHQLIDRIWGSDYVGDTKTLDVHVKRVRAKIEEDSAHPRYLTTVRGLGYKIADPE